MRDYTNLFNTYLSPEQEAMFDAWVANESIKQGRPVRNDMYDYDLKGMWLESDGFGGDNGHGTDKHKKPNHPTFSSQSKFHGMGGMEGGAWHSTPSGQVFEVGATNLYSPQELQAYFLRAEPGNHVTFPKGLLDLLSED
jgi:hypothetical protein